MSPKLNVAVNCKGCSVTATISISSGNEATALSQVGWDFIYDTSKGIEIAPFCPECITKAKILARQLQDLVKLDHWQFASLIHKN